MDQEEPVESVESELAPQSKPDSAFSFLKTNRATVAIIAINIIVFVIMCLNGVSVFEPTGADIVNWGGNIRSYTVSGEWWRLITSVFVHIGIVHILFNMYALLQAGIFLEALLGPWRYLAVYISTGVIASVTSAWWSGDRVSAGASGAIFGLYGFFLALLLTNLLEKEHRKPLLQSIGIFVVYNLAYGLTGGIDNSAHIGGLVSGFIMGFGFYIFLKQKKSTTKPAIVALSLAVIISIAFISTHHDDSIAFEKAIDKFSIAEQKGLDVLQKIDSIPETEALNLFEKQAVPAWETAQKIMDETAQFKLNNHLETSRRNLNAYTALRKEQTALFIQYYKGDTAVVETLNGVNDKLLQMIDRMNKPADN